MPLTRPALAAYIALFCLGPTANATTVEFNEGEFNLPPWSTATSGGQSGGQTSNQQITGGNPDRFLSVTTTTNADTFTAHLNADFVYNPSEGAVDSLDISLDFRNIFAFGEGHGVGAVVAQQDGNLFVAANTITGSANFDWQTFSVSGLTPDDFETRIGEGMLDLSTSGAPITFGFETRNSSGGSINVGYDNYSLTLNLTAQDTDGDGIADDLDNCTLIANEAQIDSDGDGIGNRCDPDLNGDCIVNVVDLGILRSLFFSNNPDADFDNSGTVNVADLGIMRSVFFEPPGPSGLPNSCVGLQGRERR
ncbi:MAG: thrombospondin type 3 repeat-containing protein [Gammaproteobacteria bacterium]